MYQNQSVWLLINPNTITCIADSKRPKVKAKVYSKILNGYKVPKGKNITCSDSSK